MNVLLLASHAVAEYDDLRMFTDLGYDVFAPGGYENPSRSGEGIRPALPNAPHHPELVERLNETRASYQSPPGPHIDWGKARLHDDIIDWADAIIVHHFPDRWIAGQWDRIKTKRVIWRTCGQSDPGLEERMSAFPGLQIVRYSPAERRYFESVGSFAGEDALIRFGKYPDDYGPWIGDDPVVGNVTQDMRARGDACGVTFWLAATEGLPAKPAGPGSEQLPGGIGALSYDEMREYLRHCRAYLYTGTTPASYTLGLIEAMLSGVPVISIGPKAWAGPDLLFEALDSDGGIVGWGADEPAAVRQALGQLLRSPVDQDPTLRHSEAMRARAIDLFDVAKVGQQWREFLG